MGRNSEKVDFMLRQWRLPPSVRCSTMQHHAHVGRLFNPYTWVQIIPLYPSGHSGKCFPHTYQPTAPADAHHAPLRHQQLLGFPKSLGTSTASLKGDTGDTPHIRWSPQPEGSLKHSCACWRESDHRPSGQDGGWGLIHLAVKPKGKLLLCCSCSSG